MLCSVMLWEPLWCILVNFGAFWCTSCATQWPLNDLLRFLYSSKCPFASVMDHISHLGQIQNTLSSSWWYIMYGALWCIIVHFGAFWYTSCATPWPHHDLLWLLYPFKCPFTLGMDHICHSGQVQNTLLCHDMETILVHLGPFWCTSWATPWPLCIEFSSSLQNYVSYASGALKRDQSHLPSSGYTDPTRAVSMG